MWLQKSIFVSSWFKALYRLLRNVNWIAIFITLVIAWLFLAITESAQQTAVFAGFSKTTWAAVGGSLFAASLFLTVQSFIDAIKKAEADTYRDFYEDLALDFGVKSIYEHRGTSATNMTYRTLMEGATHRIWAIGMTNRHFIKEHASLIVEKLRNKPIDVIVAFWHPDAKLQLPNQGRTAPPSIIESQARIEGVAGNADEWSKMVIQQENTLLRLVDALPAVRGNLKILHLAIVTNITCLVVDDDLFFFPFLARVESTDDPTIHCTADAKLGSKIVQHFENLFANDNACTVSNERPPRNV